jgi:hypothetical protein
MMNYLGKLWEDVIVFSQDPVHKFSCRVKENRRSSSSLLRSFAQRSERGSSEKEAALNQYPY